MLFRSPPWPKLLRQSLQFRVREAAFVLGSRRVRRHVQHSPDQRQTPCHREPDAAKFADDRSASLSALPRRPGANGAAIDKKSSWHQAFDENLRDGMALAVGAFRRKDQP